MKGNPKNLQDFAKKLRDLPTTAVNKIPPKWAPGLTAREQSAYASGTTVYGEGRPSGKNGPLTLVQSGATQSFTKFIVSYSGKGVKCSLGTPYAKYLVGKYKILPIGSSAIPFEWAAFIKQVAMQVLAEGLS